MNQKTPINEIEQQKAHFNSIADEYYLARDNPNLRLLKNLIWVHFFSRNRSIEGSVNRVLEPMCGFAEGHFIVKNYLKEQFSYYGFDYSENIVAHGKRLNPTLEIDVGNVVTFTPTFGRLFDLIVLIGGLHHVFSHASSVVKNLASSLVKDGYFVSYEPTQNNFLSRSIRKKIYKDNKIFDDDTEQGFEYPDLESFFFEAGFKKVDQVYPGLLSYILYYNPDAFPKLNVGGSALVRFFFAIDRLFWANRIGRYFSFATLTLWKKL